MAINIQQLLALLQQGAPQQGAVKPPTGDPVPGAKSPAQPSVMDLLNKTASPLGAGPGDMAAPLPQKPQPDLRASLGGRMPTTQQGPRPMNMGGPPSNATNWKDMTGHLTNILGKEKIGEEDSVLGNVMNLFPGYESQQQKPRGQVRMIPPTSQPGLPPELADQGYVPMEGADPAELQRQIKLLQEGQAGDGGKGSSLFERLDAERGYSAKDKEMMGAQGTGPIASMFTAAAQEAVQRGADTPDKADDLLRAEFQDDPEIESAIAQARARYETARARSAEGPGVMEYVGYVLATLAGANPMQAAEAISRRGEKRQDEQMALQELLGAQGMKIRDRQMQRQMGMQDLISSRRLAQDQQEALQRSAERVDDMKFERGKAGRGAALQELNQLRQQMQYSNNPKEKEALQEKIRTLELRKGFFNRQLGEPEKDERGNPIGMISPDALRLLGLG